MIETINSMAVVISATLMPFIIGFQVWIVKSIYKHQGTIIELTNNVSYLSKSLTMLGERIDDDINSRACVIHTTKIRDVKENVNVLNKDMADVQQSIKELQEEVYELRESLTQLNIVLVELRTTMELIKEAMKTYQDSIIDSNKKRRVKNDNV